MYKKCGFLVASIPGLLNTAYCIDNIKNKPNALCAAFPKSPRLVHTNVNCPEAKASSKLILFVLLHNTFLIPGYLNKLSSCVVADEMYFSVSAL